MPLAYVISPCRGDEGSPLVQTVDGKERVVGIFSHNRGCGDGISPPSSEPSIFTRLSANFAWLANIAGVQSPEA